MHHRSMYRMQLETTVALLTLFIIALLYIPATQRAQKGFSSVKDTDNTSSRPSAIEQLTAAENTKGHQLHEDVPQQVFTAAGQLYSRYDPRMHGTYMHEPIQQHKQHAAGRDPAAPQHTYNSPANELHRPRKHLEDSTFAAISDHLQQQQLTHARRLQSANAYPPAPFQDRCFNQLCMPPGSPSGVDAVVNTTIYPRSGATYLWEVCWPLLVEHGFKNTSLFVPLNIRAGITCWNTPNDPLCVVPPTRNPYNGARIMDCSTWYYNTSSVMVRCPTMPQCCDDAQCYNPAWGDGQATNNVCWSQNNQICLIDWLAKHLGATCLVPFAARPIPNSYDAGNWTVCEAPYSDCEGSWTYGPCSASCAGGQRLGTFTVTKRASWNGTACTHSNGAQQWFPCNTQPCPVNCVGQYTNWTACSSSCGGGVQNRTYVVTIAANHSGSSCPAADGAVETQSCNPQPCPVDCIGSWSNWSSCGCGNSTRNASYVVTQEAAHNGSSCAAANGTVRTEACYTHECPVDCVGSWVNSTACDQACGAGHYNRTFHVTTQAAHGGAACPWADGEVETLACDLGPCPVDCVGNWRQQSNCSLPCGNGTLTLVFIVSSPALHAGAPCEVEDGTSKTETCNPQPCPVHCEGQWSNWTACNQTCGLGVHNRTYVVSTAAAHGGIECPVAAGTVETQACNTQLCPVSCVGAWTAWSPCSQSCGAGSQNRTFVVITQAAHGGENCSVADGLVEFQPCNTQPCPVNCSGAWSEWTACNQTCGTGTQSRNFLVTAEPDHGGSACAAANGTVETQSCNTQPCPVNCSGAWSEWSSCNQTCGTGIQSRTYLVATEAANGGKSCSTPNGTAEWQACNTQLCPVNCSGSWSDWSPCNQTCGTGTQSRTFQVTAEAADGGTDCSAANGSVETQSCNMQPCPVNCSGVWSEWTVCNQTCGFGVQNRTYLVTTEASNGGTNCQAANGTLEQQNCNTQPCPVNCSGAWSAWSSCNQSCGTGMQSRIFQVTAEADHGGSACAVANGTSEWQSCNTQPCPVNCTGTWSDWSACNQTCGTGVQNRTFLVATAAANGGGDCSATNGTAETRSCNAQPCPVNCNGTWLNWTACNQTCGSGTQSRTFLVTAEATDGGDNCSAANGTVEVQSCNTESCPVNCTGTWSDWTACNQTCGTGTQSRTFLLTAEADHGGSACAAANGTAETQSCNTQPCPINCSGAWSEWSSCNQTCGTGTQNRTFLVTTEADHGGNNCSAVNGTVEVQSCNIQPCPVDCSGVWSEWTVCSQTCGSGVQNRTYLVTTDAADGGTNCSAANGTLETQSCNTQPCPVNCSGVWSDWSPCNQSCGSGLQTRMFLVSSDAADGGTACTITNGTMETQSCNTEPCPVDCQGSWSEWTTCSAACGGGGQQNRTFRVTVPAANSGTNCTADDGAVEVGTCNNQTCPVDCVGSWVFSTICGPVCSSNSTQNMTYVIIAEAEHGGAPCEAANGTIVSESCNSTCPSLPPSPAESSSPLVKVSPFPEPQPSPTSPEPQPSPPTPEPQPPPSPSPEPQSSPSTSVNPDYSPSESPAPPQQGYPSAPENPNPLPSPSDAPPGQTPEPSTPDMPSGERSTQGSAAVIGGAVAGTIAVAAAAAAYLYFTKQQAAADAARVVPKLRVSLTDMLAASAAADGPERDMQLQGSVDHQEGMAAEDLCTLQQSHNSILINNPLYQLTMQQLARPRVSVSEVILSASGGSAAAAAADDAPDNDGPCQRVPCEHDYSSGSGGSEQDSSDRPVSSKVTRNSSFFLSITDADTADGHVKKEPSCTVAAAATAESCKDPDQMKPPSTELAAGCRMQQVHQAAAAAAAVEAPSTAAAASDTTVIDSTTQLRAATVTSSTSMLQLPVGAEEVQQVVPSTASALAGPAAAGAAVPVAATAAAVPTRARAWLTDRMSEVVRALQHRGQSTKQSQPTAASSTQSRLSPRKVGVCAEQQLVQQQVPLPAQEHIQGHITLRDDSQPLQQEQLEGQGLEACSPSWWQQQQQSFAVHNTVVPVGLSGGVEISNPLFGDVDGDDMSDEDLAGIQGYLSASGLDNADETGYSMTA